MASKEKRKEILAELGLTKKEMNHIWESIVEHSDSVRDFDDQGFTWKDLPGKQIRNLPEIEERLRRFPLTKAIVDYDDKGKLAILVESVPCIVPSSPVEENFPNQELTEKTEDSSNTNLSFEEEILRKIDAGESLTEREIKELVFDGYEVDRENGENRRWTRTVCSVVEVGDRFFCIPWEEGLTEYQENGFYEQPYEVEKQEYEKTILVTEWVRKEPTLENNLSEELEEMEEEKE